MSNSPPQPSSLSPGQLAQQQIPISLTPEQKPKKAGTNKSTLKRKNSIESIYSNQGAKVQVQTNGSSTSTSQIPVKSAPPPLRTGSRLARSESDSSGSSNMTLTAQQGCLGEVNEGAQELQQVPWTLGPYQGKKHFCWLL